MMRSGCYVRDDTVETGEENLNSWFKSGAAAVGLGSELVSNDLMETKDYEGLESLTRQTLLMVQKIKKN